MVKILDISHHQPPASLNYDELAKQVDWVIIRTQYGSNLIDKHYKTHHREFQKRGIPTAAYAWLRGVSIEDMKVEARDFYNRTKEFNPTFWFLDVEEKSMNDMREGTSVFLKELRRLGAKKVGIYVGHHLYKSFNLNLSEADAVWIPHYGKNDGTINSKPAYSCDIHQYTDKGRLRGYNGPLDLNRILSNKKLSYFVGGGKTSTSTSSNSAIKVGSKVTISKSASKYATGQSIPTKYKGKSFTVQQVKSDRVLLKELYSWVYKKDLVGQANKSSESTSKPSFKVGRKVKIKSSAKKYSRANVSIPANRKGKTYTIQQVDKNDVLLKELYSWVKKSDLQ